MTPEEHARLDKLRLEALAALRPVVDAMEAEAEEAAAEVRKRHRASAAYAEATRRYLDASAAEAAAWAALKEGR